MTLPNWELIEPAHVGDQICGIDEVGRGAWAGPVVAAAVILPFGVQLDGLRDSKLMTPASRLRLDRAVRRTALAVGIGWVDAREVDAEGLSWAVRRSGERALAAMDADFDLVILDGNWNYLAHEPRARVVIKGDALVTPVAAASVIAKVARDRYMWMADAAYPGYGHAAHKGYGTANHRRALSDLGATPFHRMSYAPLRALS